MRANQAGHWERQGFVQDVCFFESWQLSGYGSEHRFVSDNEPWLHKEGKLFLVPSKLDLPRLALLIHASQSLDLSLDFQLQRRRMTTNCLSNDVSQKLAHTDTRWSRWQTLSAQHVWRSTGEKKRQQWVGETWWNMVKHWLPPSFSLHIGERSEVENYRCGRYTKGFRGSSKHGLLILTAYVCLCLCMCIDRYIFIMYNSVYDHIYIYIHIYL